MTSEWNYQARRHPVAAFLTLLLLGPFVLAGALVILVLYVLASIVLLILGRKELA